MWVLLVTRKRMLRRVERHQLLPLAVCRFLHGISTPLSALLYAPSGSGSGTRCVEISSESSNQLSNPGVRVCARTDKKRSCFAGCVSAIHTQRTAISSAERKSQCAPAVWCRLRSATFFWPARILAVIEPVISVASPRMSPFAISLEMIQPGSRQVPFSPIS